MKTESFPDITMRDQVRVTGRDTAGVKFASPGPGDAIVAITRATSSSLDEEIEQIVLDPESQAAPTPTDGVPSEGSDSGEPAGE